MILLMHKTGIDDTQVLRLRQQTGQEVVVCHRKDVTPEDLERADVIITHQLTVEHLAQAARLSWVHVLSAGIDHLPLSALAERGLVLTNSSGIHAIPMAEQILGMMLMFTRRLHTDLRSQLRHEWLRGREGLGELYGQTLTIVGAGRIGQEVARKAKAFDMRVIGVKRRVEPLSWFDEVVASARLDDVLPESDFVLLLLPLTEDTHHLIGARQLEKMKSSAILLNFGRGDVVDESALIRALAEGHIAGAALDVFHTEPLPPDSPLWDLDNVLISPHKSGISNRYYQRALDCFLRNFRARQAGRPMPNRVDIARGY
ncbi:MAG: D-2-hydroxyacid dehydrogenase [Alicyclobacillus herbarius]|uniref:D-2-hydroxyacid dehydrogenase n=1 Tax=Alicyclobacillus herbarius TaxID=122960 RepID=UPI002357324A|nr:D-2-hydroxyacid dehydrogenase [Alicyclobacillus herbarius]MCL6632641.1 D-2-hydroxyacid dehydrogenase [Alicyclobacillus herbarius]